MENWKICFCEEAKEDLKQLDGSIKKQVLAGIYKVSKNPLPKPAGYGNPLGNKKGNDLTGFFKIKYKTIGIRVVYALALEGRAMNIMVISARDDNRCYDIAATIAKKYNDTLFKDIFEQLK